MKPAPGEMRRIVASMTVVCALGAAILGVVFIATDRYQEEARVRGERRAVQELLSLDSTATVLEIRQYLTADRSRVLYRSGGAGGREIAFTLDGVRVAHEPAAGDDGERGLIPLGRVFAASRDGVPAGWVVEGEARGYKNVIRFFVGLDAGFAIAGVRVVEHEEDPGLGAEIATAWFQGQFLGRTPAALDTLAVTRDPMPEDWRQALLLLRRQPAPAWRDRHAALVERQAARPVYAVTGATISSEALTVGVRATVERFRRRWALLAPHLGGAS